MTNEATTYSAVLGATLSLLRREKHIEQGVMASRMGLSQASYSRLEGGKATFSVDQMYQAAETLDALSGGSTDLINLFHKEVQQLKAKGVQVVTQVRANTKGASNDSRPEIGTFITGAALGALLVGLLKNR